MTQSAKEGKIIALAHFKGGATKTTTVGLLGYILGVECKQRVLVVDLDPQHSLTSLYGYVQPRPRTPEEKIVQKSIYSVMLGESPVQDNVVRTFIEKTTMQLVTPPADADLKNYVYGPFLAPITHAAEGADVALKGSTDPDISQNWSFQLREILGPLRAHFDYILLDCPPARNALTINALNASDYVVIPTPPARLDLEAMAGLLGLIKATQKRNNVDLKLAGIFFSKVEAATKAHREMIFSALDDFGPGGSGYHFFAHYVKRNIPLEESTNKNSLLAIDTPDSVHTLNYWLLVRDIFQVIGGPAVDAIQAYITKYDVEARIPDSSKVELGRLPRNGNGK